MKFYPMSLESFCLFAHSATDRAAGAMRQTFWNIVWWTVALALLVLAVPGLAHADSNAQLTLGAGVVVKFGAVQDPAKEGAGLLVHGSLRTGAGVVLTSERDDADAGQTGAAPAAAAAAGDWLGVFLGSRTSPSSVSIDGLTLRYGGGNQAVPIRLQEAGAALVMPGKGYELSGLKISNSIAGVRVVGLGSPQIRNARIEANGVGLVAVRGATPAVTQSSFAGNRFYGISNETPTSVVQASGNWWGHVTGPLAESNPYGKGSRVSAGVVYQPYLTSDVAQSGGPVLNAAFNDKPLLDGAALSMSGVLTLSAHSSKGVKMLEAYIDGMSVLRQDFPMAQPSTPASPSTASQLLGFNGLANGAHVLLITAQDADGGTTTSSISFRLALSAPAAPLITQPTSGSSVVMSQIAVAGTAEPAALVQVFVNGQPVGQALNTDAAGNFAGGVLLPSEGVHSIQARATNARGMGPLSSPISLNYTAPVPTVTFLSPSDQALVRATVPVQVAALDASGIAQVQVRLQGQNVDQLLGTLDQQPWSVDWDTTQVPDGDYVLRATATGNAGKTAQASRAVRVQQLPPAPPPPVLPYGVRGVSVSPAFSFGEQPILISGQVVALNAAAQPVPNATVRLALRIQGFERRITLVSDSTGKFSYSFVPQANDAGTYSVHVVHPDDTVYAAQPAPAQFTINRLSVNYSQYKLNAIRGQATPAVLEVRASAGTGAKAVRWQALAADQPSGALPPGITLDVGEPVDVAAGTSVPMTINVTGAASAGATGSIILKAFAQESGAVPRAELRLDYQLHEATPGLSPNPGFIEIGVRQGEAASGSVTLTNKGLAVARNVRAQLVTPQGTGTPAWMRLASNGDIGNLDVGQATTLQLLARPGADVVDGYYQFELRVGADNDPGGKVPVTVAVAQSGQGGVRFKMVDIYTNTLNKSGQLIAGLQGTTIKLQNEALTADIRSLLSNEQGIAELPDLPPGNYRWRASAPQHTDASGRIQVKAGLTANERVFLDSQLISIEFSVTETTITDEYHITLEATYQTQVPAPVVLMEPMSINLPDMQVGEELTGELTLSNYGLVRADELDFVLPKSDANYRYEFFGDMPRELAAKSRVVIPYRITALAPVKSLALSTSRATQSAAAELPLFSGYSPSLQIQHAIRHMLSTGRSSAVPQSKAELVAKATGCSSYAASACVGYAYACAAGDKRQGAACTNMSRISGASCATGNNTYGPSNAGRHGGGAGGGWGGGSGSSGAAPIGLAPACVPVCPGCSGGTGPGGGGGGGGSGPGPGGAGPGPGGTGPNSFGSS
ncbi:MULTISPECIES: Ig-like domain-containing protein [unclassified Acidovorax]|uniref:Ig-like domain-containing protein n=1 Tax=unclassified Acidovorax TaxID=2684926 RepID=UPI0012E286E7|nr:MULTISPECIES: Ig-like domain-containing protein [unclassified Acidovorax]